MVNPATTRDVVAEREGGRNKRDRTIVHRPQRLRGAQGGAHVIATFFRIKSRPTIVAASTSEEGRNDVKDANQNHPPKASMSRGFGVGHVVDRTRICGKSRAGGAAKGDGDVGIPSEIRSRAPIRRLVTAIRAAKVLGDYPWVTPSLRCVIGDVDDGVENAVKLNPKCRTTRKA